MDSSQTSPKFHALDAWRGVAALGVAAYHSSFLMAADAGLWANVPLLVDFFFVLSGFVICHAYRHRIVEGLAPGQFVLMRLARIYPLHLAILAAWLGWAAVNFWWNGAGPLPERYDAQSLFYNILLLNSVGLLPGESWNYPAWSIGAEFAVYLVFFATVVSLRDRLTGHTALVISVLAYAALALDGDRTLQRTFDLGALRCVGGFFLGVAAYSLHRAWVQRPSFGTVDEMLTIGVVFALLLQAPGSIPVEIATIAGFAGLVLVFARSRGGMSHVLGHPVLQFLGKISYSIYMVHALLFLVTFQIGFSVFGLQQTTVYSGSGIGRVVLITPFAPLVTLVVLIGTVALSAFTYRFIERPCRDWMLCRKPLRQRPANWSESLD